MIKSNWWRRPGGEFSALEWASFNGNKTSFRFSTNAVMMDKIEKYVHKLILKNFQRRQHQMPETEKESHLKIVHSKAA
jgi:hypothetical protein